MDGFHGSAEPDGEMRAPRVSFNIKGRRAGVGSFGTNARASRIRGFSELGDE
jgi:hypothetical protein